MRQEEDGTFHMAAASPDLGRRRLEPQMKVFTILAEGALENEQIDKLMAAMGIAQNSKKENVVVARRGGSKSVKICLAQTGRQGDSGGKLEDKDKVLGEPLDLEYVLHHREGNKNDRSLERMADAESPPESVGGLPSSRATSSKQPYKVHCWQACALEACQNKLARRVLAMTKRNWDGEPNKQQIPIKVLHRKFAILPIAVDLRIRRRAGPEG